MTTVADWIQVGFQAGTLALAIVGGWVGLATYRKSVAQSRETSRRKREEDARSISVAVIHSSTVCLRNVRDESGLLKRAEVPCPPGWWGKVRGDGPELWFLVQDSNPRLQITNYGTLPVRITGVKLRWVRYIETTGKGGGWVMADGEAGITLGTSYEPVETYMQDWTPMSPNRQEKFAPWSANGEFDYTPLPPGDTMDSDLTADLRFVCDLHIFAVVNGEEEDRELSAIRVEIVHVDIEDAHGLRWRRRGQALIALE